MRSCHWSIEPPNHRDNRSTACPALGTAMDPDLPMMDGESADIGIAMHLELPPIDGLSSDVDSNALPAVRGAAHVELPMIIDHWPPSSGSDCNVLPDIGSGMPSELPMLAVLDSGHLPAMVSRHPRVNKNQRLPGERGAGFEVFSELAIFAPQCVCRHCRNSHELAGRVVGCGPGGMGLDLSQC